MATAAQKRVHAAMKKASKQASKEGKKGNAFKTRVKTLFKQYYKPLKGSGGKSPASKKTKSKPSTRRSNPFRGGTTTVKKKIGVIWRGMRTVANTVAAAAGAWYQRRRHGGRFIAQEGIKRYAGYDIGTGEVDLSYAVPTYQGVATSMVNDYIDRKTRFSTRISRGKIFPIMAEGYPALKAHFNSAGSPDYAWDFYRDYNKTTTGYDMYDHNWDLGRCTDYATIKLVALAEQYLVPQSWKSAINSRFPDGFNPL